MPGFSLSHDALSEFFVGNADGSYDFDTLRNCTSGTPARAVIFFGSMENPNFVVSQQILGAYVQDSWGPNRHLTLQVGARRDGTLNPGAIEHVLAEGRAIPDDLDNFSRRAGLVWSPDPGSVVRATDGVFHARTPTLLFSTAHSDTGIYPRYGNAIVSPGETAFVPLGAPIDNDSPPRDLVPALSHFDTGFEDPRTVRFDLGYEREFGGDPISEKRRAEGVPTFAEAAERVREQKRGGGRGRWHAQKLVAQHGTVCVPARRPPARVRGQHGRRAGDPHAYLARQGGDNILGDPESKD